MFKKRGIIAKSARICVLILLALTILVPMWLVFVSSFRKTTVILTYPPRFWPKSPILDNYKNLFNTNRYKFLRWGLNSIIVSTSNTALVIAVCSTAAYAFAKLTFKGKKFLFTLSISTMMIPQVVTVIPLYVIVNKLNMVNTYSGLILPTVGSAFGVFLLTNSMGTIPTSLRESAYIDGCHEWGIFLRIILPISIPYISILTIFNFMTQWGSLLWPLIIINTSEMRTLPLGIASMKTLSSSVSGEMMAATFLSFLPVLVVFMFFRRKFIEGITAGAIKG
jgi:multiple sugar transport system permease protein